MRLADDPDVIEPIKFLREREIVHFQRFGEALRIVQDNLNSKNFYAINPEFDMRPQPRRNNTLGASMGNEESSDSTQHSIKENSPTQSMGEQTHIAKSINLR